MEKPYDYYQEQLNKVQPGKVGDYAAQFQLRNGDERTKWLSLNDESASKLVKWLKEYYDISDSSTTKDMRSLDDKDFIIDALNIAYHSAVNLLGGKRLGDIEIKNLQYQRDRSLELIGKIQIK